MINLPDLPAITARTQGFTLGRPRSFTITNTGVLFLRSPHGEDPVTDLWCLPITEEGFGEEYCLVDAHQGADVDISPEEAARRERVRERAQGIVAYSVSTSANRVAFSWGSGIGIVDIAPDQPVRTLSTPGSLAQPTLSPDGQWVAGVIDGALWVIEVASGEATCLAQEDGPITWGLPDFVAAEEMGRTQGFWWSPDSQRLLVTRVDNTALEDWWISGPVDPDRPGVAMPYPPAGGTNAEVGLWRLHLDGQRDRLSLTVGPDHDDEYLATLQWLDDDRIVASVMPRTQHRLRTLVVPSNGDPSWEIDRIDQSPWVDIVPGLPHAFIGEDGDVHLLTARVVDNQRAVCLDGQPLGPGQGDWSVWTVAGVTHQNGVCVGASGINTHEPWADEAFIIDAHGVVPYAGTITLGQGGPQQETVVVSRATSLDGPPVTTVRLIDRDEVIAQVITDRGGPLPQTGVALYGPVHGPGRTRSILMVPGSWQPSDGPLPVLVHSYGGPHARMVVKDRTRMYNAAFFAAQGYAVVITDGLGAPGGGMDGEFAIYKNLHATVQGQVDALDGIDAQFPGVLDRTRVGISGWSYGGYLAARAVLERPDVFKAAISGAPVTDWRLYDTHYTERYLGNPNDDPTAYEAEELARLAQRVDPATWGARLLLIHGLADDNVVVAHTLRLSASLLAQGLPHEVLPLSDVTHFTPSVTINTNLLLHELDFLRRSL